MMVAFDAFGPARTMRRVCLLGPSNGILYKTQDELTGLGFRG
jgi:hypothetical protein